LNHTESVIRHHKPAPSIFFRWVVLLFLSISMFSNYYLYDCIAPVADKLKSALGLTDTNIGWFYSSYSVAAIIVLLIGGIIIDKWGTKKSAILFGSICTVAGFITAVSSNLYIMLIGRFLLGVGSEPLIAAITAAIAKWFKGKELSFAMGINLLIARSGSVASDNSPSLFSGLYTSWQYPLYLGAFIGVGCLVSVIIYYMLETKGEKNYVLGVTGQSEKLVLSDLFFYSKSFWLIVLLCVTFYSAIFPFRSFAIKYFIEGHGLSREAAGWFTSILPLSAMIATPLIGLLVDFIGKRALLMMLGSLLILPVYLLMAYTDVSLYIITALMGISFSLIPAIMWPSVAYIVAENRLGSAYCLMALVQQIGVAAFNWMIGTANDYSGASALNPSGYNTGMWIFTILGFLGFFSAYMLRKTETGPNAHGLEKGIIRNEKCKLQNEK
jgi:MFS family permease